MEYLSGSEGQGEMDVSLLHSGTAQLHGWLAQIALRSGWEHSLNNLLLVYKASCKGLIRP